MIYKIIITYKIKDLFLLLNPNSAINKFYI